MRKIIEVCRYFIRLGFLGFGGPLALIAQMQKELVEDRHWLSGSEFSQAFALIKAMPGPVATQMAIYLGRRRAGRWGGFLAGFLLLFPSFVLMIVLARAYSEFIESPLMLTFLEGLQMGALALIFYSLRPLTQTYWRSWVFWFLFIVGYGLTLVDAVPESLLIFVLGCWAIVFDENSFVPKKIPAVAAPGLILLDLIPGIENYIPEPQVVEKLFWICLRAGAFIFGSGLAIIPALQADFVVNNDWISADEFRDALAFGQMTPGPVVITVTFLGYKMAGLFGATVATVAVFAPSFFHQLTWFPRAMDFLSRTNWIRAFLLGAVAAVSAGILYVVVQMTKDISSVQGVIFGLSLILLFRSKIQPALLVLIAGAAAVIVEMI